MFVWVKPARQNPRNWREKRILKKGKIVTGRRKFQKSFFLKNKNQKKQNRNKKRKANQRAQKLISFSKNHENLCIS